MIDKKPHKVKDLLLLYWNGEKWLVRQTFAKKKDAEDFLNIVAERKAKLESHDK